MATEVFVGDVGKEAYRDGKDLYAATSESIKPGLLCIVTCGSSVSKAAADSDPVWGVAYGARHQVYRPTSKTFADGEELALLKGKFSCYYSSDFFTGGTLPSAGDTIYAAASGLLANSGSVTVGRCERSFTRTEEVGGVGTSQSLVEVRFNLT